MVVNKDGACLRIELVEDVTSSWIQGKLEQIKEVMEEGEGEAYGDVVVDMERVQMIDSIGVSLIIALYKTAGELNKDFKVVGLNSRVKKLFTMMKLDEIFPIDAL